jgi:hypothetical protein
MSPATYISIENNLQLEIKYTAWDEMQKAGEKGKKLAIESGDIDIDGIPLITVVTDGQWSKRSYSTKYDALSGVVSIEISKMI